jgi:hypothetical protein
LERYSKTCYFSRQISFVSKNPLPLSMGSMSIRTGYCYQKAFCQIVYRWYNIAIVFNYL